MPMLVHVMVSPEFLLPVLFGGGFLLTLDGLYGHISRLVVSPAISVCC